MTKEKRMVTDTRKCTCCGNLVHINVQEEDLYTYYHTSPRPMVQNLFSYLTNDEREMYISGICPVCWDEMFSDEDDEDCYEISSEDLKEWQDASCGRC